MAFYQYPNGEVHNLNFEPYAGSDAVKLTNTEGKKARAEYCRKALRKLIRPGQKVFCTLRAVSSSGMSRRISLHVIHKGELRSIDSLAADLMDYKIADGSGGLKVSGCGMDMGFHLVYNLGRYLWPKGTKTPHGTRNGAPDSDGGYALKSEWV